jgi:hypothetical protein
MSKNTDKTDKIIGQKQELSFTKFEDNHTITLPYKDYKEMLFQQDLALSVINSRVVYIKTSFFPFENKCIYTNDDAIKAITEDLKYAENKLYEYESMSIFSFIVKKIFK